MGYVLVRTKKQITPSIYLFIPPVFIELLLCTRFSILDIWGRIVSKTDKTGSHDTCRVVGEKDKKQVGKEVIFRMKW